MTETDHLLASPANAARLLRSIGQARGVRHCWPWAHEWTKWRPDSARVLQYRTCLRCGLTKARVV